MITYHFDNMQQFLGYYRQKTAEWRREAATLNAQGKPASTRRAVSLTAQVIAVESVLHTIENTFIGADKKTAVKLADLGLINTTNGEAK
jgi:hypothetical protein